MSRQATKADLLAICRALGLQVYQTQSSELLATLAVNRAHETRRDLIDARNELHKLSPATHPKPKEYAP